MRRTSSLCVKKLQIRHYCFLQLTTFLNTNCNGVTTTHHIVCIELNNIYHKLTQPLLTHSSSLQVAVKKAEKEAAKKSLVSVMAKNAKQAIRSTQVCLCL